MLFFVIRNSCSYKKSGHKKEVHILEKLILFVLMLTLLNGKTDAQTLADSAISLDGNNDYIQLGTYNNQTELTIEAWVRVSGITGDFQAIVSSQALEFVHLQMGNSGNTAVYYNSGFVFLPIISPNPQNEWRHIAISCKSGDIKIFENGNLFASAVNTFSYITNGNNIRVGSGYAGTRFFNGAIDEVRIWNVARSIEQIQATMNDTLNSNYLTADSGLIAYYRFDKLENLGVGNDGLVDDVRDLSISASHGDLVGDAFLIPSNTIVGIDMETNLNPDNFSLKQNYPNPFNPNTKIKYELNIKANVNITIYNINGRKIKTLVNQVQNSGEYTVSFDATGLASGIYIYKLKTDSFKQSRKMLLVR